MTIDMTVLIAGIYLILSLMAGIAGTTIADNTAPDPPIDCPTIASWDASTASFAVRKFRAAVMSSVNLSNVKDLQDLLSL